MHKVVSFLKSKILTTARSEGINRFDNSVFHWVFSMNQASTRAYYWTRKGPDLWGACHFILFLCVGRYRSCGKLPKILKKISDSSCARKEMGLCVRFRERESVCLWGGGDMEIVVVGFRKGKKGLGWQCELRLEESIIQWLKGPDNLDQDPESRTSWKSS